MSQVINLSSAVSLMALTLASSALASPLVFNDPTRANVLREFNLVTKTNIVGNGVVSGVGNSIGRIAANDGTGWNDESDPLDANESVTHTWTLAGPRKIGSYNVSFNTPPDTLLVEYFNGSIWQTWDTFNGAPAGTLSIRNPADVLATGVRYTASNTGPQLGERLRLNEIQVLLDGTDPVGITDGYNWFTDSGRVSSTGNSVDGGPWDGRSGDANTLRNNSYTNGDELKSQNVNTDRAFVRYSFSDPARADFGVFGGTNGQGWENFEVYTANGALPATQALVANDSASIISAGWTLQLFKGPGVVGGFSPFQFDFLQPGVWDHLLVVFDTQAPSMNELEIYAVPEPTSIALLGVGLVGLLRFRARRSR